MILRHFYMCFFSVFAPAIVSVSLVLSVVAFYCFDSCGIVLVCVCFYLSVLYIVLYLCVFNGKCLVFSFE